MVSQVLALHICILCAASLHEVVYMQYSGNLSKNCVKKKKERKETFGIAVFFEVIIITQEKYII